MSSPLPALLIIGGGLGLVLWQHRKDRIRGGLADKRKPSSFNKKQLNRGMQVEMEHTSDKKIAREIARDHLTEDSDYYKKLAKMEQH